MPPGAPSVKTGEPSSGSAQGGRPQEASMIDLLSSTRRLLHHARLGGALLALAVVACGAQSSPSTSRGLAGLADTGVATASDTEFDTAPGDYLAGNFAVDSGRLGEAADYFQRALEADPNNLDLLRQLFLLTLASGRYDAAIDQARSLVPRDPEADEARLLQAMEQVRAGKFDDARTALKGLGAEGVAGLTAPFLDAWAIFGAGGPAATDAALARLGQGKSLGPLNGYHKAMMLDLGGRLDDAAKALGEAMPGNGPAPVRIVQAYASILTRHGERDTAIKAVREQVSDGRELPVLVDLLATLEAGGSPAPPFTDAAGGMADALLGIAEALHQERGNSRAIVYARLAMYVRPDLVDRRRVRCRGRGGRARDGEGARALLGPATGSARSGRAAAAERAELRALVPAGAGAQRYLGLRHPRPARHRPAPAFHRPPGRRAPGRGRSRCPTARSGRTPGRSRPVACRRRDRRARPGGRPVLVRVPVLVRGRAAPGLTAAQCPTPGGGQPVRASRIARQSRSSVTARITP